MSAMRRLSRLRALKAETRSRKSQAQLWLSVVSAYGGQCSPPDSITSPMWTLTVSYAIARDYAQCRWLTGPPGERCGNAKVAGVPWTCTDLGICALDAN